MSACPLSLSLSSSCVALCQSVSVSRAVHTRITLASIQTPSCTQMFQHYSMKASYLFTWNYLIVFNSQKLVKRRYQSVRLIAAPPPLPISLNIVLSVNKTCSFIKCLCYVRCWFSKLFADHGYVLLTLHSAALPYVFLLFKHFMVVTVVFHGIFAKCFVITL